MSQIRMLFERFGKSLDAAILLVMTESFFIALTIFMNHVLNNQIVKIFVLDFIRNNDLNSDVHVDDNDLVSWINDY